MKCIHHNDMDGRSAARVVADFEGNYNESDFFERDYSESLPYDKISENEKVYIVDYSFTVNNREKLDKILEITDNVIWVDHHRSSIELINSYPTYKKIKGVVKEGISGAALSYMYLHKKTFNDIPKYLKLISDYDCWIYEFGDESRYFKCFIDSVDYKPFAEVWGELNHDTDDLLLTQYIDEGRTIKRYLDYEYKRVRESQAYELNVEGHKALVINADGNSWLFGDEFSKYELCMLWVYDGNIYNYSLYSDQTKSSPLDVSKIAEKYGGGGHPGASGVQSKTKIW